MLVLLRSPVIQNGRANILKKYCFRNNHILHARKLAFKQIKHDQYLTRQKPLLCCALLNNPDKFLQPVSFTQNRNLSLSIIRYESEPLKPSSKVEVTVQALKEKQQQAATVTEQPKAVVKKSIPQRIKEELIHYYHGFRLLFIDMKISFGLVWRILNGHSLSRREYRLLMRTVGDMFRLVPFSVFIIVPFMELLLPFFIKFFPGMLPSTFQTATEKEDKMKQNLKVKLEMAKFLQQTLDDMSVQHKDHNSDAAKEFTELFHKVRTSGEQVGNEEILKFSKLFQDEITLDSLSRSQLVALCRVLEVQTLGTNNLLRFQLRMKLRSLAADDKMIQKEGVDSLSLWEVQQACRARGMRAFGVTEARLRSQLQDWLDLSLNEKVPPSLLLLSRALMLPETIPTSDKLKATISALPDTIVTQTKAAIGEKEGKIDNRVQLEIIQEEVRKIKEERQELGEELKKKEKELLMDKAPVLTDDTGLKKMEIDMMKEKENLISKDVEAIEDALDALSKEKQGRVEKVEIKELKEQMADYQEDVKDLTETVATVKEHVKETKAAKRLFKKVHNMINKMDLVLGELEARELQKKKEIQAETKEQELTTGKREELLKIEDVMQAIKKIKNVPDESRLEQIKSVLSKIDDDRDGSIKIEDVLKVIEFIGKENVQLNSKQVDELVEMLDKEEILEVESKIEKALKKQQEAKQSKEKSPPPPPSSTDSSAEKPIKVDSKSHVPPSSETVKTKNGSAGKV